MTRRDGATMFGGAGAAVPNRASKPTGGPVPVTEQTPPAGRQRSLSDVAYEQILADIMDGVFAENARLPAEGALAERFGISRPVVREALARLRDDGLIVSRQGSGSYVTARPARAR